MRFLGLGARVGDVDPSRVNFELLDDLIDQVRSGTFEFLLFGRYAPAVARLYPVMRSGLVFDGVHCVCIKLDTVHQRMLVEDMEHHFDESRK